MKKPNYLVFGMIWLAASIISIMNFIQYLDDRGNLVRGGIFLMLAVFYFWMNDRNKRRKK